MSTESIAEKILPYRNTLLRVGGVALIFLLVDWQFNVLSGANEYVDLAASVVTAYILIMVLSADILVGAFHPRTGFLRPSSKWAHYFPWLRYGILSVMAFVWALPAIVIVKGFT